MYVDIPRFDGQSPATRSTCGDTASRTPGSAEGDVAARAMYLRQREFLITRYPAMQAWLPPQWPPRTSAIDRAATITALRQATSTLNHGLLILGYGDGTIIELLRQDPVARGKAITLIVLASELEDFVSSLGRCDIQAACSSMQLQVQLIVTAEDMSRYIITAFAAHHQIAQLAGTTILDSHPLAPAAEELRRTVKPALTAGLTERFDCLGNDVYDTFLGAKHILMNGDRVFREPRTSDYKGRYAGKSALCIASGPSCAAHYERIRAIQHEHVVICADSILGGLLKNGIEPDFVCMVERGDEMHKLIDEAAPKCRTVLFAAPWVHPLSVAPFGGRVAWWWPGDLVYNWLDATEPTIGTGRSTGTMAVALAGHLGVATAYLIGHDLAFHEGQSHGDGVAPLALEAQGKVTKLMSRDHLYYQHRLLDVPKNGGGTVVTSGTWTIFRSDLEVIILNNRTTTTFVNVNVDTGVGAVIAGCIGGRLPEATGQALGKEHPVRITRDEDIQAYRERRQRLLSDFDLCKEKLVGMSEVMKTWRPLQHDQAEVEAKAYEMALGKLVSKTNANWFEYVFRAAMHNLLLRMHHRTQVRTLAERNWMQVQVMRQYLTSMALLIDRLRPELAQVLETVQ
jgi:hypothetical protein